MELLRRTADGDQLAFAHYYDATSHYIFSLVLYILKDESAAEEVTLEVYFQVWRQAARYDPRRAVPIAWTITLARSRALDRLRARGREQRHLMPFDLVLTTASAAELGPEASVLEAELRRAVRGALTSLRASQREVIELAYFGGLSHTEIAAELGIPLGTVKARARDGMIKLRARLTPLYRSI